MRKTLVLFTFVLISGCSQKFADVYETVELAVTGYEDYKLTDEEIKAIPYASIYARVGEGPQAFLVLGYYENQQAKWFSADAGMLVTHHGRLVRTLGLAEDNIEALTAQNKDPLELNLALSSTPKHWRRTVDWSPGYRYNCALSSTFEWVAQEVVIILGQKYLAEKYVETVLVEESKESFLNYFWIKPDTGEVLKSQQQLGPGMAVVEIIQLKRFKA